MAIGLVGPSISASCSCSRSHLRHWGKSYWRKVNWCNCTYRVRRMYMYMYMYMRKQSIGATRMISFNICKNRKPEICKYAKIGNQKSNQADLFSTSGWPSKRSRTESIYESSSWAIRDNIVKSKQESNLYRNETKCEKFDRVLSWNSKQYYQLLTFIPIKKDFYT